MTTFFDLTRSFDEGLSKITSFVPNVVSNFQNGDNTFRGRKNDLYDAYEVNFQGLGALAFANAVENNIEVASRLEQKLSEFVTASDHTSKQMHTWNQQYNDDISNFVPDFGEENGLAYYGLDWQDVKNQMRDGTLSSYIDFGFVIELGKGYLLGNLDQAKQGIASVIQYNHSQNMDNYQNTYNLLLGRNPSAKYDYQQNLQQQQMQENSYFYEANRELTQIYNNQHDAFSGWFDAMQSLLGTYDNQIAWAGATGEVSVGDILQDLLHAPNGSPLVIYQTPDGNLVVAVNTMNDGKTTQQNALLVQQAIAEYESANGLTNVKVTVVGYQGGGDVVQQLAVDQNPFQITNVVLIGDKVTQTPNPLANYTDYVAPGDNNAGTGSASIVPSGSADVANDLVDGGEIVLGAATGGPAGALVATGEVIVSTVVPMAFSGSHSNVNGADPNSYFQNQVALPPNETHGYDQLVAIPSEPVETGTKYGLTTHWPFYKSSKIDYSQSTYLNMRGLPDPGTGKTLQGVGPLSPPTYYNF